MRYMLAACLFVLPTSVFAQSGSSYDWQNNNYYTWNSDRGGTTRYQGYNFNNGSMWGGQIDRRGNQRGYDRDGNYWTYDSQSKTYLNFGTGKMCTGTGYGRICN